MKGLSGRILLYAALDGNFSHFRWKESDGWVIDSGLVLTNNWEAALKEKPKWKFPKNSPHSK